MFPLFYMGGIIREKVVNYLNITKEIAIQEKLRN